MQQFYDALKQEASFLQSLLDDTSKIIRRSPDGKLHVSAKGQKHFSYYHFQEKYKDHYPNGKYIPLKDLDKIRKLAQKEYAIDVNTYASLRLKTVRRMIDQYEKVSLHSIYQNYKPGRKCLICPCTYEPDYHLPLWENTPCRTNPYLPEKKTFLTNRGEYVRSKSEKFIADRYYAEGIPYRYEPELKLKKRVVYPDFQILNVRTGKEYYHEHLGKMGDMDYASKAVIKIEEYIRNGIYPGENLLITAETGSCAFTGEILDEIIDHYLK